MNEKRSVQSWWKQLSTAVKVIIAAVLGVLVGCLLSVSLLGSSSASSAPVHHYHHQSAVSANHPVWEVGQGVVIEITGPDSWTADHGVNLVEPASNGGPYVQSATPPAGWNASQYGSTSATFTNGARWTFYNTGSYSHASNIATAVSSESGVVNP